jgi:DegV family protein with EDD domain
MSFVILSDSACDLTKVLRERFNIEYVMGHMTLPDGTERRTTLEWDFTTPEQFYKDVKAKKNFNPETKQSLYTTAPASIDEFKEEYKKYLDKGEDLLVITISTGLSATYNFAAKAAEQLKEEYTNRKIIVIDSLRYSTGLGLLVVRSAEKRAEGLTLEECAKWVEENKSKCHQMGFLDDLSFVAMKGRISKPKAFMGQMIGIKPLAEFSYEGLPSVLGKTKGDNAFYDACIKYIEKTIRDPKDQIIFIAQTAREKQALELKKRIEEKFQPKEVIVNTVHPQNGINIGPGLCAAYYFGTEISKDLSVEKEYITQILNSK